MASEAPCKTQRRYERISLPKGMTVAWYGGGDSQVSRLKTLGSGGLFLLADHVRPVGTTLTLLFEVPGGLVQKAASVWCPLTLLFEVPGGLVQAEAVVRNISPNEGMGVVEFTNMCPQARVLLELQK